MPDLTSEVLPAYARVAVFGGVYNNYLALERTLADARRRGAEAVICLGDVGAFGPHPDRSIRILREAGIPTVQGNYDHSVGHGLADCQCGYTDPRDNHYAHLSYTYTFARTGDHHREWLRERPPWLRTRMGGLRVHLCHGSPRRTNEFLWASTTPEPFLRRLLDQADADLVLCTHTGLHFQRRLEDGRGLVNVGVIGRPDNDGDPAVHYALLTATADAIERVSVEFVRLPYAHERLAREMESEGIAPEFVATVRTGWWTTCLEVLPARERAASRY